MAGRRYWMFGVWGERGAGDGKREVVTYSYGVTGLWT